MRAFWMAICVAAGLLCSCAGPPAPPGVAERDRAFNAWLARSPQDRAARKAVRRQNTLFPYHFRIGRSELNELGRDELGILLDRFRQASARLNIRRGDASQELYQARVAAVKKALVQAGIKAEAWGVSDLPATGDGMPSEQVLVILKPPEDSKGQSKPESNEMRSSRTRGGR